MISKKFIFVLFAVLAVNVASAVDDIKEVIGKKLFSSNFLQV